MPSEYQPSIVKCYDFQNKSRMPTKTAKTLDAHVKDVITTMFGDKPERDLHIAEFEAFDKTSDRILNGILAYVIESWREKEGKSKCNQP